MVPSMTNPVRLPLLLLNDGVVLPGMVVPIELDEAARANFDVSVDAVKELLVACKGIDESLA